MAVATKKATTKKATVKRAPVKAAKEQPKVKPAPVPGYEDPIDDELELSDEERELLADGEDEDGDVEAAMRNRPQVADVWHWKRSVTAGTHKLNELAARLDPAKPKFPYPVDLPDHQKEFWLNIVNSKPVGFFEKCDMVLLRMYVRNAADLARLDEEITADGDLILNMRGDAVVNPKIKVRTIVEARLVALSTKLMSQPSSRNEGRDDMNRNKSKRQSAERAAEAVEADEESLLARPMYGGGSNAVN